MLGYIKALASRARLFAEEAGQNLVETALIIGVVSVVLVGVFMGTNIQAAVEDAANRVSCEIQGDTWTEGGVDAPGSCADQVGF